MHPTDKAARIAGALYLSIVVTGPFSLIYVPNKLIVRGNATATASNILAHETLFRFGIVAGLVSSILFMLVVLALYRLLSRVNKDHASVMVILGMISVAIGFADEVNNLAALILFRGGDFLTVIDKPQREALGMLFIRLHGQGIVVNELFWGLWLLPFGILVMKSGFLPRILGAWLIANCLAYVAMCFTDILAPQYGGRLYNILFPVLFGEIAITLWLLIIGAKVKPLAAS